MGTRHFLLSIPVQPYLNWIKGKGEVRPITGHEGPEGEYRYSSTLSLTSALDGVGGQRHAPGLGTHCIGGWVGLRTGLDRCQKSRPAPGFDPRTV